MKFRKLSSIDEVAEFIAGKLIQALSEDKKVLWLVPGGSAIKIAADVSQRLQGQDLSQLSASLTDERYGPLGHADCNWLQLEQAGFSLAGADLRPVLTGDDREVTTRKYSQGLEELIEAADYSLGFFGIGPDGHTAGILPGSPAVNSQDLAASYDAGNFERITMTPQAIGQLDEAVVYAVGEAKWPVLDQLEQALPLDKQPAQALKTVSELTVFNDYKGEKI